jgi:solute carrier family 25 carnitine/acylcarnitine transporter 20/29
MASWLPVYPIDVVKTEMQNTLSGMESERPSMTRTAMRLYETQGLGVFWEGLDSKLLRACVNHAVAFYVFDLLMSL